MTFWSYVLIFIVALYVATFLASGRRARAYNSTLVMPTPTRLVTTKTGRATVTAPVTLDLTGGKLNVRCNKGDGEAFVVPLPADLTAWTFTATAGVLVTVTATQMVVRVPASVTAALVAPVAYTISCRQGSDDPTTLLSGLLTL